MAERTGRGGIGRRYGLRAWLLLALSLAGLIVSGILLCVNAVTTTYVVDTAAPFDYQGYAGGQTVHVWLSCFSPWDGWTGSSTAIAPGPALGLAAENYNQDVVNEVAACDTAVSGREHLSAVIGVPSLVLGGVVAWKGYRSKPERRAGPTEDGADSDNDDKTEAH